MEEKNWIREIVEYIGIILFVVIAFFLIRTFLFAPYQVNGDSMDPTLKDGQRLIQLRYGEVQRGDIVVFDAPDQANTEYVKRVIGVPGDMVEYDEGILYINDQVVDEPYLDELEAKVGTKHTQDFKLDEPIPAHQYLVLGDNRPVSNDSRYFGTIDEESITGISSLRIWPLNAIGLPE